ncbi:MAG: hypothetical protein QW273_03225 [Candidatus Pacearchaeota archaeon]
MKNNKNKIKSIVDSILAGALIFGSSCATQKNNYVDITHLKEEQTLIEKKENKEESVCIVCKREKESCKSLSNLVLSSTSIGFSSKINQENYVTLDESYCIVKEDEKEKTVVKSKKRIFWLYGPYTIIAESDYFGKEEWSNFRINTNALNLYMKKCPSAASNFIYHINNSSNLQEKPWKERGR